MQILPFKIDHQTFALELDHVRSVESIPRISLVPNSKLPAAGIILRRGGLLPVWNSYALAGKGPIFLKSCRQYIEAVLDEKSIALPVDGVDAVQTLGSGWLPRDFYGLKIYRLCAEQGLSYRRETPARGFAAEEIGAH